MNRFSKWNVWALCAVGLGAILIAVGCGTTSSGSSNSAQMRILHLSPGEPNLDLLIDSKTVSSGIAYGMPTGFIAVAGGNHELKVKQSNTTNDVYDILKEPFSNNTSYTYLIVGNAPAPVGQKLVDDHSKADSGKFKIRVVNGSPDSGPVDVYLVTPGASICVPMPDVTLKPTISGLASLGSSTYQSLASGGYEIAITAQGIKTTCLLQIGLQSFSDTQNRTFVMYNAIPNTNGPYNSLTLADLN